MATGHLPFDGEQPVTIALKHIQEAPAPITDYDATLPAALDKIVRKALSKQKQQRYASAIEMEEDLAMVVEHPDGAYVDFDDSQLVEPEPPLELSGSGRSWRRRESRLFPHCSSAALGFGRSRRDTADRRAGSRRFGAGAQKRKGAA